MNSGNQELIFRAKNIIPTTKGRAVTNFRFNFKKAVGVFPPTRKPRNALCIWHF